MTAKGQQLRSLSLKDAFESEFARRETERLAREDAERRQQEDDLASAQTLYDALSVDGDFLEQRGLMVDIRRYTVTLDHADYRIAAYFEAGKANVTTADKRTANPGSTALRKRETADTVEDALRFMAQFLADETL